VRWRVVWKVCSGGAVQILEGSKTILVAPCRKLRESVSFPTEWGTEGVWKNNFLALAKNFREIGTSV
jgi:hypothetical protein